MTADTPATEPLAPIYSIDSLPAAVPVHEPVDTVPDAVVDQMAALPDLASVGITNDDGEVLLRRLTETCSWKIPTASVASDEDFVAAIDDQIPATIGLAVDIESVRGVWDVTVQTEDNSASAARTFVVFEGASPTGEFDLAGATPTGDAVEEAAWFETLPDDADEVPGTALFFD
jgi:hypothetical protein